MSRTLKAPGTVTHGGEEVIFETTASGILVRMSVFKSSWRS